MVLSKFFKLLNQSQAPQNTELLIQILKLEEDLKEKKEKGENLLSIKNELWKLYSRYNDLLPAERYLKEIIEEQKDLYGSVSEEVAESYANLSEVYFDKYQLRDALDSREITIGIKRKLHSNETVLVKDWIFCGDVKKAMQDIDGAKKEYEHCVKLLEINENLGNDYGVCLYHLGTFFSDEQNYEKSKEYLLKASKYLTNDSLKAKLFLQLGNVEMYLGGLDKAEQFYQEGLHITRNLAIDEKSRIGEMIYSLAVLHATKNNIHMAENMTFEAIKIFEQSKQKALMVPKCYMNLGTIYKESKPQKSIEMFKKALEIIQDFSYSNTKDTSFIYCSIGEALDRMGNYNEAYNFFQKALEIIDTSKNSKPQDQHINGTIFMNLGIHFSRIKNYEEAEKNLLESYRAYGESFSEGTTPETGNVSYHLGKVYMNVSFCVKLTC